LRRLRSLLGNSPLRLYLSLPPGLEVGPQGQRLHDVPGVSQATGHVHQRPVAGHVGEVVDAALELGLGAVNVVSLPNLAATKGVQMYIRMLLARTHLLFKAI
jgi:hypothetical protein